MQLLLKLKGAACCNWGTCLTLTFFKCLIQAPRDWPFLLLYWQTNIPDGQIDRMVTLKTKYFLFMAFFRLNTWTAVQFCERECGHYFAVCSRASTTCTGYNYSVLENWEWEKYILFPFWTFFSVYKQLFFKRHSPTVVLIFPPPLHFHTMHAHVHVQTLCSPWNWNPQRDLILLAEDTLPWLSPKLYNWKETIKWQIACSK